MKRTNTANSPRVRVLSGFGAKTGFDTRAKNRTRGTETAVRLAGPKTRGEA